jgi:murein DD-endopeptidase MepM/ murein hydrolase activator NlpD
MDTAALQISSSLGESQTQSLLATGKTLAANPAPGTTPSKSHQQMEKAAHDFESFLYGHMFKTMYNSVQKSEFTQNSMGTEMFMQMFIDEASKQNLETGGNNSIAAQLMKQYESNMAAKDRIAAETLRKNGTPATVNSVTPAANTSSPTPTVADTTTKSIQDALTGMVGKLAGKMTSEFGMRKHPIFGDMRMHDGIDIGLPQGTDLSPPIQGKVAFAGVLGGYGNAVIVDHGHGWMTKYGHLSEIAVKEGDIVNQNDVLGKVGSTGVSTGPHLHFEVLHDGKPVNPMELAARELPKGF